MIDATRVKARMREMAGHLVFFWPDARWPAELRWWAQVKGYGTYGGVRTITCAAPTRQSVLQEMRIALDVVTVRRMEF